MPFFFFENNDNWYIAYRVYNAIFYPSLLPELLCRKSLHFSFVVLGLGSLVFCIIRMSLVGKNDADKE